MCDLCESAIISFIHLKWNLIFKRSLLAIWTSQYVFGFYAHLLFAVGNQDFSYYTAFSFRCLIEFQLGIVSIILMINYNFVRLWSNYSRYRVLKTKVRLVLQSFKKFEAKDLTGLLFLNVML